MKTVQGIAAIVVLLSLAGCQLLPSPPSVSLYRLPEADMPTYDAAVVPWSLRISTPRSSDALTSNRLMVMTTANELTAYPGVRWEASVPELWRDHLHKALLADGRIPSVSTVRENLLANRELLGTLRDFQAELDGNRGEILIRYDAVVAETKNRKQIARKTFIARQAILSDSPAALVAGFGQAAESVSKDLVNWLLSLESN